MSILRSNIKPLVNIDTLIFDNFVKLKTNFKIPPNEFVLPLVTNDTNLSKQKGWNIFSGFTKPITKYEIEHDCSNSIKIQDLDKLKLNNSIKKILQYYNESYSLHQKILLSSSDKLKVELGTNTYFEGNFEEWVLTNFVRKYNITGKELFLEMTRNNSKYQDIWNNQNLVDDNRKTKYFDYCEGFGLKNHFPIDIYNAETKLNLRSYVDRSGSDGYLRLIKLFENKIKSKPVEYVVTNDSDIPNDLDTSNLEFNDKHNPDSNASDIIIPLMSLDSKQINYYNHNMDDKKYPLDLDYLEKNNSNYKLNEELNEFKKFISDGIKNKIFNLDKYFKYVLRPSYDYYRRIPIDKSNLDNYILTPRWNIKLESVSVANCIVFGESNIRYGDVEKLLSLIRFDSKTYSYSIDNFKILYYSGQVLTSNTDNKTINQMNFCCYQDMVLCAKWLIQIMNNINPSQINHHNYHTLVQYCKHKDNPEEQYFNYMTSNEQMRIKEMTFEEENI